MAENQAVKIRISKEIEMKTVSYPSWMKRNGKTGAGAQRWRCGSYGASTTLSYDDAASRLGEFLAWPTSEDTLMWLIWQHSFRQNYERTRPGMVRRGRLGGAPSQGLVPLLAGLARVFYRDTLFVL